MSYNEFYEYLLKYRMITPIWKYEIELIKECILNEQDDIKNNCLILFLIYFSLIQKGNATMALTKKILKEKWENELEAEEILYSDKDRYEEDEIESTRAIFNALRNASTIAYNYLHKLQSLAVINKGNSLHNIFEIRDDYLYLRKYNHAREEIIKSIKDLFSEDYQKEQIDFASEYNPNKEFKLTALQQEAVKRGVNSNLIITGGPGTGKTTTIVFILFNILLRNPNYNIYLAAASGKASSRMKESIINGINNIDDEKEEYRKAIDILKGITTSKDDTEVEEFTIHRLLGVNFETGGFRYNKKNQFEENSIFVIDEASMIDICLFKSLLDAIPSGARVFILGDKDQLPSVEVGAVFGDLVKSTYLRNKNKVVELLESKRFKTNTAIYKLAEEVNKGDLPLTLGEFKNKEDFNLSEVSLDTCPVYYFYNKDFDSSGNRLNQKENIEYIIKKWADKYYKKLQDKVTNIPLNGDRIDDSILNEISNLIEEAKILSAENEGIRGIKSINAYIKKLVIDKEKTPCLFNQYPGELMMINKNNSALNLYNGDTGILVSIENDDTIYYMVKKTIKFIHNEGYKRDEIFKIKSFVFYPLRLITLSEIELSYAITIHKSQGSDYKNILVILPTAKGHPLLNRQILYTAITRTKGNTYILSNKESLEAAASTNLTRDTNINLE